jgi:hypothetical protein
LPGGVGAPKEHTLRNIALADVVDSNGHEVVVLNAYSNRKVSVMEISLLPFVSC